MGQVPELLVLLLHPPHCHLQLAFEKPAMPRVQASGPGMHALTLARAARGSLRGRSTASLRQGASWNSGCLPGEWTPTPPAGPPVADSITDSPTTDEHDALQLGHLDLSSMEANCIIHRSSAINDAAMRQSFTALAEDAARALMSIQGGRGTDRALSDPRPHQAHDGLRSTGAVAAPFSAGVRRRG